MGVDDDLESTQPTPDDVRLGARIANLAEEPSAAARARIMAAVRGAPMPASAPRRRVALGRRWRLALVGFGTTGILVAASAGALAASSDALPNSPTYELRHVEENLRVAVASQREQPRLRLQFAAEKLRQAKAQIRNGDAGNAARLVSDSRHDLQDAEAELKDLHDPAESQAIVSAEALLQADAANQQDQVNTLVNGGTVVEPPSPAPSDGSNGPAPEVTPLPPTELAAPPDNGSGAPEAPSP
jgi:hypothetical protein